MRKVNTGLLHGLVTCLVHGSPPAYLQSEEGESDPVAATRARIDALKLSGKADSEEKTAAEGGVVSLHGKARLAA